MAEYMNLKVGEAAGVLYHRLEEGECSLNQIRLIWAQTALIPRLLWWPLAGFPGKIRSASIGKQTDGLSSWMNNVRLINPDPFEKASLIRNFTWFCWKEGAFGRTGLPACHMWWLQNTGQGFPHLYRRAGAQKGSLKKKPKAATMFFSRKCFLRE